MEEIWKDIPQYEGLYQVSNLGRVFSVRSQKCLAYRKRSDGYVRVALQMNGKRSFLYMQRLVANVFIPNPNDLPEVNHKDENPGNNAANNLEWCTHRYNINYGTAMARSSAARSKTVEQIKDGAVVRRWENAAAAEREGFDHRHISGCCNGKRRTHKGYEWRFAT